MDLSGIGVLVLDDDAFQRSVVTSMLTALGVSRVTAYGNGRKALDALKVNADKVDVVICDLEMPDFDGVEFLVGLADCGLDVSVVLLSAKDERLLRGVQEMAIERNVKVIGRLRKPASLGRLGNLIETLAARPRPQSGASPSRPAFTALELTSALDAGEFEPFFQPKVALSDRRLVGAEALARWRHPRYGVLAPGAFLPAADETFLRKLDHLMLQEAVRHCRTWLDAGLDISVSINTIVATIEEDSFPDQVVAIADPNRVPHSAIILEVVESQAVSESPHAMENLLRLRMREFGLSIDDYGTGFSSLRQLTRIPFTEMKIDRMFVTGLARKPDLLAVVESSLSMAGTLGLNVVGEGVETAEDWECLKKLGCPVAQGYFVDRPMDAGAFLRRAVSWPVKPRHEPASHLKGTASAPNGGPPFGDQPFLRVSGSRML